MISESERQIPASVLCLCPSGTACAPRKPEDKVNKWGQRQLWEDSELTGEREAGKNRDPEGEPGRRARFMKQGDSAGKAHIGSPKSASRNGCEQFREPGA